MARMRPPRLTYLELSLVGILILGSFHSLYGILHARSSSARTAAPITTATSSKHPNYETFTIQPRDLKSAVLVFPTKARFVQFQGHANDFLPAHVIDVRIALDASLNPERSRTPASIGGSVKVIPLETLVDPLTQSFSTEFVELPQSPAWMKLEIKLSNGKHLQKTLKVIRK